MLIYFFFFPLGSSTQNWPNKDCKSVQIYHRQYSGRKNSGTCRNETPARFHSHPARQVVGGNFFFNNTADKSCSKN